MDKSTAPKMLDTCRMCGQPVYDNEIVTYGPTDGRYHHLNCPDKVSVSVSYDTGNVAYWHGQVMNRDGVIEALRRSLEECAEQIEHCLGTSNPTAQRARELVKQTGGDGR